MHCFSIRRMWIHGLPKGLEVLAKGLEYALLTTERAAKTCHDTGSGKQRLEKQSFTCFLVLPDEFIDNQIDNVAITKKLPNRVPGSQRPNPSLSSLEWRTSILWLSWSIYLGGPAWPRNLPLNIRSKDPKRWTESAAEEGAQQYKNQAVPMEIPSARWRQTVDSRLLTMKCPLLLILWRWMEIDLQINSHCLTCSKTM